MIVDFTLSTEENDEALVMEKVLEISKHIKQVEFKIDTISVAEIRSKEKMESIRKIMELMKTLDCKQLASLVQMLHFTDF